MRKSLSYLLLLSVLKFKKVKKTFSQNPIDYQKLRKEDVKCPKGGYFKKRQTSQFNILESVITEIPGKVHSDKLVIFIPGGAFISGPAKHHWDSVKTISKNTNLTIWLCDYPKAPENKITKISKNIDHIYDIALQKYKPENIILIGDSVGGTLIAALIQRLVKMANSLPSRIILISPVMDATVSNPTIGKIDQIDPMLSKKGVLSAKKMCIGDDDLKNSLISPLFGSFENFPPTTVFLAENDITFPDQLLMVEKLEEADVKFDQIKGEQMPHIWPLLPVLKEGKVALKRIIRIING